MSAPTDPRRHRARPWRVHTLASDFELLDLWEVPLGADPVRGETFARFLRMFATDGVGGRRPVYPLRPTSPADVLHGARLAGMAALLGLRRALGLLFALDTGRDSLRIPGTHEARVRARLDDADRGRELGLVPATIGGAFETVYTFPEEALFELANKTIHALLHLSWVEAEHGRYSVVLAIYVKSRGWGSRAYLALIAPFRHLVVYPAWIEHVVRTWQLRRASFTSGEATDRHSGSHSVPDALKGAARNAEISG